MNSTIFIQVLSFFQMTESKLKLPHILKKLSHMLQ